MINSRTKFIFKILFFVGSCMLLCSCPGSSFVNYKLLGSSKENIPEYYDLIVNSDTIKARVGILHNYLDKGTGLLVKIQNIDDKNIKVMSTQYGELSLLAKDPHIYRKELYKIKKKDTLVIAIEGKEFYFGR
ncbi:hypothetical protein [Chryseobacterium sp. MMS23-Vi53]|uniref:hypothetical protein n=1 Tax=Chryseobacterium sp. MMS23-Vi53 TaxID=3386644 RepID=UPI0039E9DEC5